MHTPCTPHCTTKKFEWKGNVHFPNGQTRTSPTGPAFMPPAVPCPCAYRRSTKSELSHDRTLTHLLCRRPTWPADHCMRPSLHETPTHVAHTATIIICRSRGGVEETRSLVGYDAQVCVCTCTTLCLRFYDKRSHSLKHPSTSSRQPCAPTQGTRPSIYNLCTRTPQGSGGERAPPGGADRRSRGEKRSLASQSLQK